MSGFWTVLLGASVAANVVCTAFATYPPLSAAIAAFNAGCLGYHLATRSR